MRDKPQWLAQLRLKEESLGFLIALASDHPEVKASITAAFEKEYARSKDPVRMKMAYDLFMNRVNTNQQIRDALKEGE